MKNSSNCIIHKSKSIKPSQSYFQNVNSLEKFRQIELFIYYDNAKPCQFDILYCKIILNFGAKIQCIISGHLQAVWMRGSLQFLFIKKSTINVLRVFENHRKCLNQHLHFGWTKMPKMVVLGEFLIRWSLRFYSVTRHVNWNEEINSNEMRHFE